MTTTLQGLGFHIIGGASNGTGVGANQNLDGMRALIYGQFLPALVKGGVALIYFAGHGLQVRDRNYIVPVGATISTDALLDRLIDFGSVVDAVASAVGGQGRVIALLDACREAPFSEVELRHVEQLSAPASHTSPPPIAPEPGEGGPSARGLGLFGIKQNQAAQSAPKRRFWQKAEENARVFVGFATAPGYLAYDSGAGENSPFATALGRHLGTRALEFNQVYDRVKLDVKDMMETQGLYQDPWSETNFDEQFFLNPQSWQPVATMGLLGLVAGALMCFGLFGSGRLADPFTQFWPWGLGFVFAAVLAYGTVKWGSGKPVHVLLALVGPTVAFAIALAILQIAPLDVTTPGARVFVSSPHRLEASQAFEILSLVAGGLIAIAMLIGRRRHRTNALGWISFMTDMALPFVIAAALLSMERLFAIYDPWLMVVSVLALLAAMVFATGCALCCKPQHSVFRGFGPITGAITIGLSAAILFLVAQTYGTTLPAQHKALLLVACGTAWFALLGAQLGYCFAYYVPEHERAPT
jgi:hypothetical protein